MKISLETFWNDFGLLATTNKVNVTTEPSFSERVDDITFKQKQAFLFLHPLEDRADLVQLRFPGHFS